MIKIKMSNDAMQFELNRLQKENIKLQQENQYYKNINSFKNPNEPFSENLKRIRKLRQLSQAKLAKASGLNINSIQSYENGTCEPKLPYVIWLAEALDVTVAVLIGEV